MSVFTAPLITQYMPDTKNWALIPGFRYYIGEEGSNRWVDVPTAFHTDGASVPRPFWWWIPPWGEYGQAAALHDFLCTYRTIIVDGKPVSITRKEADGIFLEAMTVLEVDEFKRNTMYRCVRAYAIVTRK